MSKNSVRQVMVMSLNGRDYVSFLRGCKLIFGGYYQGRWHPIMSANRRSRLARAMRGPEWIGSLENYSGSFVYLYTLGEVRDDR